MLAVGAQIGLAANYAIMVIYKPVIGLRKPVRESSHSDVFCTKYGHVLHVMFIMNLILMQWKIFTMSACHPMMWGECDTMYEQHANYIPIMSKKILSLKNNHFILRIESITSQD